MRLIDADEFMKTVLRMKRINEECPLSDIDLENEKINNYETRQRETFDLITEHLDAQPTAYDPDKVLNQLNDKFRVVRTDEDLEWNRAMDEAITIVKGGGVDAQANP